MANIHGIQLFDGLGQGLENVLDLRRARHALGASNIANADTPGYLAKELPFEALLVEVMEAPLLGDRVSVEDRAVATMVEREAPESALDGNSVDAEHEATQLIQNQVMYEAVAGGLSRRMAMLRFAASDGKM